MPRIIFVPQFPTKLRYQELWFSQFPKNFKELGFEVIIIGENFNFDDYNFKNNSEYKQEFSPIQISILFETYQINEYIKLKLLDDDILFLSDISFPGLFTNILYHKKPKKCFAYCHGTSKNKFDYFQSTKKYKWKNETSCSMIFDTIFVASKYHQNKLKWNNTKVVGLPSVINPLYNNSSKDRKYQIVSVARPTIQKVNKKLEKYIDLNFEKITRQYFQRWIDYFYFLSQSKILFISSKEDTFNYSILDAIQFGCIPIAPNKLAFPEILPSEYLYNNKYEACKIIKNIINNKLKIPILLCQDKIDNFFINITNEMIKER